MTLSRADTNRLLESASLRAKRALGQNFVVDPNTVRRIARLARVDEHSRVIEIGAGLGALTLALAETGATITAVEVDDSLIPLLTGNVDGAANVRIVHADAMSLDWPSLLGDFDDWVLVANLPYNVATPLVADILDFVPSVKRMLVMVQKEVGDRFVARPSSEAYGALSVKVSYHATASIAGLVPASVFLPRPNVESALVEISRRSEPLAPDVDPDHLFRLVRAGFAKRRKMLRGAMAGVVDADDFECAGIAPTARAEELAVDDWIRLARCVAARGTR